MEEMLYLAKWRIFWRDSHNKIEDEKMEMEIYNAPQPMPNVTPSPKVQEVLDKCKVEIDKIYEDLCMDKLGYEGYYEQANNKIVALKEQEQIDDDTFRRLCNYLNYQIKKDNEVF